MNWNKNETLMASMPAPADILALLPGSAAEDDPATLVHTAAGERLTLAAPIESVLAGLAAREAKDLRLIRQHTARQLARRRNIILPILHGCVLMPIMVRPVRARRTTLGYINTSYATLIVAGADEGTDVALRSGAIVHSLWQPPTVQKIVREARAVHFKLLLDVSRQLRTAEELG